MWFSNDRPATAPFLEDIMNRTEYEKYLEKSTRFAYTSFQYRDFRDLWGFQVLADGFHGFLLGKSVRKAEESEIIWAANDPEEFRSLMKDYPRCLVKFIPTGWAETLKHAGFREYGVLREYWIPDLSAYRGAEEDFSFGVPEEAGSIASLTRGNRHLSREFLGETPAFVKRWMEGTDSSLGDCGATNARILVHREGNRILGAAFVAIYGLDSPKGGVLWLRELAVKNGFHGRGIGRTLARAALQFGCQNGAKRSFLMADDLNASAIRLYRSLGYLSKDDEVQIDLISA